MPIYDFQCPKCSHKQMDVYLPFTHSDPIPCTKCGRVMERMWSNSHVKGSDVFPFTTKNIHPEGKPVTVKSEKHLKQLCAEHGAVHRPDAAWINKDYKGYNVRTQKHEYAEGNGCGMPGSWV